MEFNIVDELLKMTLLGTEWVLWLLIALSILSVCVIIERAIYFLRIRLDFQTYTLKISELMQNNEMDKLEKYFTENPSFESEIALHGLKYRGRGRIAMEEAMSAQILAGKQSLDTGLVILGTLGNNAPFIGLFGTVLGIIQAFHDLAANPDGGTSVVMAGISEALVATAVGLLVAIPAVSAYNTFQRIVKMHLTNGQALIKTIAAHTP